jgi:VCBS repeat-containing protein
MSDLGFGWFRRKRAALRGDGKPADIKSADSKSPGTSRPRRSAGIMALEPRIMYDAAAAATVGAAQAQADGAPDHAAISAAEKSAPVTPSNTGAPADAHATQQPSLAQAPNVQTPAPPPALPEAVRTDTLDASHTTESAGGGGSHREVVFIDPQSADLMKLYGGVKDSDLVFVLDPTRDGVQQIADILEAQDLHDLDAIHIVSHGTDAQVRLGTTVLSGNNAGDHAAALAAIGATLNNDGDILLYGCDVAAGTEGQQLIADLARLTGADVAASTDPTGSANRGGDWTLEASTGAIGATNPFTDTALANYDGLLAVSFGAGPAADPIGDINPGNAEGRMIFGDFDNDGDIDVLYQDGNTAGTGFGYKQNNGAGVFTTFSNANSAGTPFTSFNFAGQQMASLFVVDYDNDGDVDIVDRDAVNGGVGIWKNTSGNFGTGPIADPIGDIHTAGTAEGRMIFGDFDNDGDLDILYQDGATPGAGFGYKQNNGAGVFAPFSNANSAGTPFTSFNFAGQQLVSLFVVDYDNDGDTDIVDRDVANGGVGIWKNTGGNFGTGPIADPIGDIHTVGVAEARMIFGDFDSDGDIDILYQDGATSGTGFGYKQNDGHGAFTTFSNANSAGTPFTSFNFAGQLMTPGSLFVEDYDHDGDVDILDRDSAAGGVGVWVQGSDSGGDGHPPQLASTTPGDGSTTVLPTADITLTFSETVLRGTGNITLVDLSGATPDRVIDVNSAQVTGSGNSWTINPTSNLASSTHYAVRIDAGAFKDADGAIFFGINDNTTLDFTTATPSTPPTITSNGGNATASVSVAENSTAVTTVTASDPDPGTTLTYSITGGDDMARFAINSTTGALTFVAAPDFETPGDVGANNIYDVVVQVTDGALTDSQAIAVTVTNANDAPVIIGSSNPASAVTEEADASAQNIAAQTGTLTVTDADTGDTLTASVAGNAVAKLNGSAANVPGGVDLSALIASGAISFTSATSNGSSRVLTWTWDPAAANLDFLKATDVLTIEYMARVSDGTASSADQLLTITINGSNDAAVLSSATVPLTEADTAAAISTSGTLTVSDLDAGQQSFVAQNAVAGTYGSFSIGTNGDWTYIASSAHNEFVDSQLYSDTFVVTSADGTTTSVVINITGTNDAAVLSSDTRNLTETNAAASISSSGTLTISDADSAATFVPQTGVAGTYGTFSIAANGAWTYTASSAHNEFALGTTYTDTFGVASADGTTTSVVINIAGSNDAAVLSSDTRNLTETNAAADISASGTLTVSDVDNAATFVPQTNAAGSYGTFSIDAAGAWTYTAGSAHNEFAPGTTYTDTFTVASADGTTTTVVINILGTNDAATFGGTDSGAVTEDTTTTAGGTLTVSDPDTGQSSFGTGTSPLVVNYGTFTFNSASGAWTYNLDHTKADSLVASQVVTDTLTVHALDGTAHDIVVTITGTNDAPVATGLSSPLSVLEQTALNLKTRGLSISDIDGGGGLYTVTLSVTEGVLNVTAGTSGVAGITGSGTSSVEITGTLSAINALLSSDGTSTISYIDNTDTPGNTATLTLTVMDGQNATGSAASTITLVKVNDAPTVAMPAAAYSVGEGNSLNLKNTGLSVGDVDGGAGTETVTLSVSEGVLLATAGNGETVSGSGTSTITITGTLTQINALLGGGAGTLSYIDNTDRPSTSAVLTLSINDNGNTGGGALTASATKSIAITAGNDTPVGAADAFSVSANPTGSSASLTAPAAFGLLSNDRDPDGDALVVASVNGNAVSSGSPLTLTLAYGTLVVSANGSFTYTPTTGGATGTDSFTYRVSDGTTTSSDINVAINVVPLASGGSAADTLWTTVQSSAPAATTPASIPDTGVIRVNTDGTVTRVYGNTGTTGEGRTAPIVQPSNIVVDVANNLYYMLAVPSTMNTRDTGYVYMGRLNSTAAPTIVYFNPDPLGYDGANIDDIAIDPTTRTLYISQRVNWNNGATGNNGIFAFTYDATTGTLGARTAIVTVDPTYSDTKVGHQISYMTQMPINGVLYYAQVDYTTWTGTYQLHAVNVTTRIDTVISTPGWPIKPLDYHNQDGVYINDLIYNSANSQLYVWTYDQLSTRNINVWSMYTVSVNGGTPSLVTVNAPGGALSNVESHEFTYNSGNGLIYMSSRNQFINAYSVSADGKTLNYVAGSSIDVSPPLSSAAGTTPDGYPNDVPVSVFYTPGNKAPTNAMTALSYTTTEQTVLTLKGTGLSIADADGGNSIETVRLSVGEGTLNVTAGGSGAAVSGSGSGTVTITGTLAQINALLGGDASSTVNYINNSDTPSGHTTLTFSVTDNGNLTATDVATIFIAAVNDAPTAAIGPASYNATEQTSLNLKNNGLVVGDVDAGTTSIVSVILSVGDGVLNVTAGSSGVSVSGSGTGTVTLTGRIGQINNLLTSDATSTVSYINSSDTPIGSTTLTLSINDGGNTGSGGAKTASDTATINIAAANDAPVAREDVYSGNQGNAINGSSVLANDSDVDTAAGSLQAVLVGGPGHAASFTLNADGTFSYTPAAGFSGSDYFTYKVNDGSADSNTVTVAINIASSPMHAVNDSYSVDEDNALTVTGTGVLGNDSNDNGLAFTATVQTDPAHGTLVLNPDGSFTYTPDDDFYGTDTFTYQASDGTNPPALGTVTITVAPVNDVPVLTPPSPAAVTYVENAAATPLFAGETITDVDNPANFGGATLSVALLPGSQPGDRIELLAASGFSVTGGILYDGATAIGTATSTDVLFTVTLNTSATPAVVNRLATAFGFRNSTDNPGATLRTVELTFNDGGNVGTGSHPNVSVTQDINVTPVADAPVVTAGNTVGYTEQATAVVIGAGVTIADADSATLTRATVTITDYVAGDTLTAPAGVTVISNDNGVLVFELTGSTSPDDYQAALRQVTFASGSDDPTVGGSHGTRTIAWTVTDDTGEDSAAANTTLTITADNDAPTVVVPGTLRVLPSSAVAVTGVVFADPDGSGLPEQATFSAPTGTFTATSSSGVTVSGTSSALVLTGSIADLNAYIEAGKLTFRPVSDTVPTPVSVQINDLGHTGTAAQTATATFTVAGNAPPTVPADTDSAGNTVEEGAAVGTLVGITALATDSDPGNVVTYSIVGRGSDAFKIDPATGVVSVKNGALIDYESNASHTTTITVQADDGHGGITTADFVITVTDRAPSVPADADGVEGGTISEDAVNGATVGITASSTDVNGGAITYSLTDNAGGRFQINGTTGVVTVLDASLLDYEDATSHSITVQASDGTLTSSKNFTIAITNVAPSTPVDGNVSANSVSEGAVNGDLVGVVASSTDIHGGTVTYTLSDDAGGRFTIDASTGAVSVANASLLDFETATSHSITVRASDPAGLYTEQSFTIAVINVAPSTPVDGNAGADSVSEGAVNGDLIGITASSVDIHGGQVIYSLADDAGGRFAIDSATGVVSVANASLLDFESNTSHTIVVRAADPGGLFTQTAFTIAVTNVPPSQPVDGDAAANAVLEGAANGTVVGLTGLSTDVHGGTVTYALSADASNGGFAIDAVTGVVTVADAGKVDFESSGGSYAITIRASDPSGAFTEQSFTIAVINVAPVATGEAMVTDEDTAIVRNAAQGLLINDTDINGAPLTAVLDTGPAHGTLTLNPDGSFSYLSFPDYFGTDSFSYHVSDGTASSAIVTVNLTINPVNDAPVLVAGNTLAFDANTRTPILLSPGISLHDVDSTTMVGARIAITGGYEPADDTLGFVNQNGIVGSFDRATGVLTLTGTASVADYQAALASITFISTTFADGTRTVQWTIDDGSALFSQSVVTQTALGVSGIIVPPPVFADRPIVPPTQIIAPPPLGFDTSRVNLLVANDRADGYGNSVNYGYQVVYTKPVLMSENDSKLQIDLALAGLWGSLGGDVVYVIARQANGDPLPDWLTFDSVTGKFAGVPPDGMVASIGGDSIDPNDVQTGALPPNPDAGLTPPATPTAAKTIVVEVLARDSKGNVAVTTFVIELRPRAGKQGFDMDWSLPGDTRHASLSAGSPELAAIEAAVREATGRDVTAIIEPFAIRGLPAPMGEPIIVGEAAPGRAGLSEQMAGIGWRAMTAQTNALLASLQQGR